VSTADWRPGATAETLRRRAGLLEATRSFFAARGLLEVETPVLVRSAVTDPQLASFTVGTSPERYLQTSPEHAMKRLLAAGSGDIWQLARVFRQEESSTVHNPEFTMVEWYRLGFDMEELALETCQLVNALLVAAGQPARGIQGVHYRDALASELGFDPLSAAAGSLRDACRGAGLAASSAHGATRDDLLDFLMAVRVGPRLGARDLTWVHHYPASQAALARIDPEDPGSALRFEVYADGVELANGFVELASPGEQRARFEADRAERRRRSLPQPPVDESLLAALQAGLPPCAGVALGFDRVVMLALGARHIDEVIAFGWDRA
jgi:elongation factor P--(R)-beta-lysine ligase